ncbi:MAG: hypothetical protein ACREJP_02120 [Candidatus Methylomirabilales bacterium]
MSVGGGAGRPPNPAAAGSFRSLQVQQNVVGPAGLVVTEARTRHDVERVSRELAPLLLGTILFDPGVRR